MVLLVHILPSPRALVARSERAKFESWGSDLGEAANEAKTVLPEAALHTASAASLLLEPVLHVSGRSKTGRSSLVK